jgi:hypothetical protein
MPDSQQNRRTDPTVTVNVGQLLTQMSLECANATITNDTQLSATILGLSDVQTAALMRRLLAVCVHVGPPTP